MTRARRPTPPRPEPELTPELRAVAEALGVMLARRILHPETR